MFCVLVTSSFCHHLLKLLSPTFVAREFDIKGVNVIVFLVG